MQEMLELAVKAADKKLAFDMNAIDLQGMSSLADYFVIVSGNTDRQVMAIAEEVEHQLEKSGHFVIGKEGHREGDWVLLDYGDLVVHVFQKEARSFYGLDELWKEATKIEIEDLIEVQ